MATVKAKKWFIECSHCEACFHVEIGKPAPPHRCYSQEKQAAEAKKEAK